MSSTTVPTPPAAPPIERRSATYTALASLLVGIPLLAYAARGVDERRLDALPATLIEIVVWTGLLFYTMRRHPRGELRLSEPFGLMLVMFVDFFILPAVTWLHGADPERSWGEAGALRSEQVGRIQLLHVLFMVALTTTYFAVAPRKAPSPLAPEALRRSASRALPILLLGLLPTVLTVLGRFSGGGGVVSGRTYGEDWGRLQDQVETSRGMGGSDYFATQLFSKFWYFPLMALGVGNGVLLAQYIHARTRWKMLLVFLQIPALLLLGTGGRSAVFIPFIMSMAVADALVGPLKWRWVSVLGVIGMLAFGFYGQYRVYQDRGFSEATALATESYTEASSNQGLATEGTIMLVKEAYGLNWTDANQFNRGFAYFPETFGAILPMQIVPMKAEWMNTANFLSHELLGHQADLGGGVAGAVIVDGYMMFNELGVLIIAVVLGLMLALVVRGLLAYDPQRTSGPPLWRVLMLMTFNGQMTQFIRSDPGGVLNLMFYYILLPALMISLVLQRDEHSVWNTPVRLEG